MWEAQVFFFCCGKGILFNMSFAPPASKDCPAQWSSSYQDDANVILLGLGAAWSSHSLEAQGSSVHTAEEFSLNFVLASCMEFVNEVVEILVFGAEILGALGTGITCFLLYNF